MTMSQQPTYLLTTTCLANAVAIQFATQTAVKKITRIQHTLESLHIFLESNYKEVGLKILAEYRVQHLFVRHEEFQ